MNTLNYAQELATRAHDLFCDLSHQDQCAWGYEGDPNCRHYAGMKPNTWENPTRAGWLYAVNSFDPEHLVKALDAYAKNDHQEMSKYPTFKHDLLVKRNECPIKWFPEGLADSAAHY